MDTNIVVRAMINVRSASGWILAACETRLIIPLLSRQVLLEYHETLTHPELLDRYPELEPGRVKFLLERLAYLGDVLRTIRIRFPFPRDPRDAKFIELAVAGRATHLITGDPDLLDLAVGHDVAAKRFRRLLPNVGIVEPREFIARHHAELGAD